MNQEQNRRDFLKNALAAGTGFAAACIFSGCSHCLGSKDSALARDQADDYSRLAYCCLDCSKCELLIATRDKNEQLRREVASKWGMYKQEDFRFDKFYCFGCKSGKPGQSEMGCTVKKCAEQKGIANCAYCDNLDSCDQNLWKEFPWIKEKAKGIRAEILA